jgi:hypothetical protein
MQTARRTLPAGVPGSLVHVCAGDRLAVSVVPPTATALFPNIHGGRIDFGIFGRKHGRPRRSRPGSTGPRPLRPAPHLRHLRAPRRRAGVRGVAVHGYEHRHDRPSLRPSRQRQPRTRSLVSGCARAGGGRCVDVVANASAASQEGKRRLSYASAAPSRGRSVDLPAAIACPCLGEGEIEPGQQEFDVLQEADGGNDMFFCVQRLRPLEGVADAVSHTSRDGIALVPLSRP